jgi:hypothetical protein
MCGLQNLRDLSGKSKSHTQEKHDFSVFSARNPKKQLFLPGFHDQTSVKTGAFSRNSL